MAATGIEWNMRSFFAQWKRMKGRSDRAGSSFVRFQAKMLGRALAWFTPIAPFRHRGRVVVGRGRARAGWWAAVSGLGGTTVYTNFPDRGEGSLVDGSMNVSNPRIVMTNGVPYITKIVGHGDWPQKALAQQIAKGNQLLDQTYRKEMQAWL